MTGAAAAEFKPRTRFEPKVALLKFYPSMPTTQLDALRKEGFKGVILEGTGLGHVNALNIEALKHFISEGGMACMTSQCINGMVDLNVYETGRDLLEAGVIQLGDMLGETALAKAMWVLGNAETPEEARTLMVKNIAGEMTTRRFPG
jgi:glutamyl-tRNA(Gln) amidotransferase subunit D